MQAELFSREEVDTTGVERAEIMSKAIYRHMMGSYDHVIKMEPMPSPRPRFTVRKGGPGKPDWVQTYMPTEYTKYKEKLAMILRGMVLDGELERAEYETIFVTFHFTYPASTPKKKLIEAASHRKRPDGDNCMKTTMDATQEAQIFSDDGCIANLFIRKQYTLEPEGYIGITFIK